MASRRDYAAYVVTRYEKIKEVLLKHLGWDLNPTREKAVAAREAAMAELEEQFGYNIAHAVTAEVCRELFLDGLSFPRDPHPDESDHWRVLEALKQRVEDLEYAVRKHLCQSI